jgi:hypothetical protein
MLCVVLDLVVADQRSWSVAELARVTDDPTGAVEAVHELVAAGLANHVAPGAVRASRSARYAVPDGSAEAAL